MGGKPRAPLRREAGCRRRWALSLHLAVRGSLYTRGRKNSTGSYNAAGPYTQGGQGVGRRGLSSFCLHIRCGCFASPPPRVALHHHVPAIAAVSLARTVPPLHGMLKKKKKVGGKSHCGVSSLDFLARLVKQGQDKGNSKAE